MADELSTNDPFSSEPQSKGLAFDSSAQPAAGSELANIYAQPPVTAATDELQGPAPTKAKEPAVQTPDAPEPKAPAIVGDYDKRDTRVQFMQRIGQQDADLYSYINARKQSADGKGGYREATNEEVSSEVGKLAKATYQAPTARCRRPRILSCWNSRTPTTRCTRNSAGWPSRTASSSGRRRSPPRARLPKTRWPPG